MPWSPSWSAAGEVGGHAEPTAAAQRPDVRVAALARGAVGPRVLEARVDESDLAQELDADVRRPQVRSRVGPPDPGEESRSIHEGAVGIGGHVVLGQVLRVPAHVGLLRGEEIASVERLERLDGLRVVRHRQFLLSRSAFAEYPSPYPGMAKEPVSLKSKVPGFTEDPCSSTCARPAAPSTAASTTRSRP